jgi:phenylpyruvate tautomerase PptA (4-oxalocrotonate tautomerase family)
MRDIPGTIIGLVLAFVLCVIMPFVNVTVQDEMLDRRYIVNDVTNFLDEVIDSREVTDAMLDELNVNLASYGMTVDYEIKHYKRSVNVDPLSSDDYYVTYIETDDIRNYEKGDKISVHVYTVGYSATQSVAHKLTQMFVKELDTTITARVR